MYSHRLAIFGYTGVGLDIFWYRDCHKSMYNTIKYTETCSSLLAGSPAKFADGQASLYFWQLKI